MKMNYDDLKRKAFGWAFLIVEAILFSVGRQSQEPAAFTLMAVVYIGAWIHTNMILSNKERAAREQAAARDSAVLRS